MFEEQRRGTRPKIRSDGKVMGPVARQRYRARLHVQLRAPGYHQTDNWLEQGGRSSCGEERLTFNTTDPRSPLIPQALGKARERGLKFATEETVGVEMRVAWAVERLTVLEVRVDIRLRVNAVPVLLRNRVCTGVV